MVKVRRNAVVLSSCRQARSPSADGAGGRRPRTNDSRARDKLAKKGERSKIGRVKGIVKRSKTVVPPLTKHGKNQVRHHVQESADDDAWKHETMCWDCKKCVANFTAVTEDCAKCRLLEQARKKLAGVIPLSKKKMSFAQLQARKMLLEKRKYKLQCHGGLLEPKRQQNPWGVACLSCRNSKVKCDGKRPCERCCRTGRECKEGAPLSNEGKSPSTWKRRSLPPNISNVDQVDVGKAGASPVSNKAGGPNGSEPSQKPPESNKTKEDSAGGAMLNFLTREWKSTNSSGPHGRQGKLTEVGEVKLIGPRIRGSRVSESRGEGKKNAREVDKEDMPMASLGNLLDKLSNEHEQVGESSMSSREGSRRRLVAQQSMHSQELRPKKTADTTDVSVFDEFSDDLSSSEGEEGGAGVAQRGNADETCAESPVAAAAAAATAAQGRATGGEKGAARGEGGKRGVSSRRSLRQEALEEKLAAAAAELTSGTCEAGASSSHQDARASSKMLAETFFFASAARDSGGGRSAAMDGAAYKKKEGSAVNAAPEIAQTPVPAPADALVATARPSASVFEGEGRERGLRRSRRRPVGDDLRKRALGGSRGVGSSEESERGHKQREDTRTESETVNAGIVGQEGGAGGGQEVDPQAMSAQGAIDPVASRELGVVEGPGEVLGRASCSNKLATPPKPAGGLDAGDEKRGVCGFNHEYTARENETPRSVSKKVGIKVEDLIRLNAGAFPGVCLRPSSKFRHGTRLVLAAESTALEAMEVDEGIGAIGTDSKGKKDVSTRQKQGDEQQEAALSIQRDREGGHKRAGMLVITPHDAELEAVAVIEGSMPARDDTSRGETDGRNKRTSGRKPDIKCVKCKKEHPVKYSHCSKCGKCYHHRNLQQFAYHEQGTCTRNQEQDAVVSAGESGTVPSASDLPCAHGTPHRTPRQKQVAKFASGCIVAGRDGVVFGAGGMGIPGPKEEVDESARGKKARNSTGKDARRRSKSASQLGQKARGETLKLPQSPALLPESHREIMSGANNTEHSGESRADRVRRLKKMGIRAVRCMKFDEAIEHYTEAISLSNADKSRSEQDAATNSLEVLYANRSSAYASSGRFEEALVDADQCILLEKSAVGYLMRADALVGLDRLHEAEEARITASRIQKRFMSEGSASSLCSSDEMSIRQVPNASPERGETGNDALVTNKQGEADEKGRTGEDGIEPSSKLELVLNPDFTISTSPDAKFVLGHKAGKLVLVERGDESACKLKVASRGGIKRHITLLHLEGGVEAKGPESATDTDMASNAIEALEALASTQEDDERTEQGIGNDPIFLGRDNLSHEEVVAGKKMEAGCGSSNQQAGVDDGLSTLAAVVILENGIDDGASSSGEHPALLPRQVLNWNNWRNKTGIYSLKDMITNSSSNHLLIDTRSKEDYECRHAWTAVEVSDVLEKYSDLTSRPVLIMNENGEMGITEDALVKALREKTGPPQSIQRIVGGFERWFKRFPHLCEGLTRAVMQPLESYQNCGGSGVAIAHPSSPHSQILSHATWMNLPSQDGEKLNPTTEQASESRVSPGGRLAGCRERISVHPTWLMPDQEVDGRDHDAAAGNTDEMMTKEKEKDMEEEKMSDAGLHEADKKGRQGKENLITGDALGMGEEDNEQNGEMYAGEKSGDDEALKSRGTSKWTQGTEEEGGECEETERLDLGQGRTCGSDRIDVPSTSFIVEKVDHAPCDPREAVDLEGQGTLVQTAFRTGHPSTATAEGTNISCCLLAAAAAAVSNESAVKSAATNDPDEGRERDGCVSSQHDSGSVQSANTRQTEVHAQEMSTETTSCFSGSANLLRELAQERERRAMQAAAPTRAYGVATPCDNVKDAAQDDKQHINQSMVTPVDSVAAHEVHINEGKVSSVCAKLPVTGIPPNNSAFNVTQKKRNMRVQVKIPGKKPGTDQRVSFTIQEGMLVDGWLKFRVESDDAGRLRESSQLRRENEKYKECGNGPNIESVMQHGQVDIQQQKKVTGVWSGHGQDSGNESLPTADCVPVSGEKSDLKRLKRKVGDRERVPHGASGEPVDKRHRGKEAKLSHDDDDSNYQDRNVDCSRGMEKTMQDCTRNDGELRPRKAEEGSSRMEEVSRLNQGENENGSDGDSSTDTAALEKEIQRLREQIALIEPESGDGEKHDHTAVNKRDEEKRKKKKKRKSGSDACQKLSKSEKDEMIAQALRNAARLRQQQDTPDEED